jgi:hypothetical protein
MPFLLRRLRSFRRGLLCNEQRERESRERERREERGERFYETETPCVLK